MLVHPHSEVLGDLRVHWSPTDESNERSQQRTISILLPLGCTPILRHPELLNGFDESGPKIAVESIGGELDGGRGDECVLMFCVGSADPVPTE